MAFCIAECAIHVFDRCWPLINFKSEGDVSAL